VTLLKAFDDTDFQYDIRCEMGYIEKDSTHSVSRKLIQIIFYFVEDIDLIRRFCLGHFLEVNVIFSINVKRISLMINIGLSNEGK
jgi:hypothetical protein